MVKTRNNAGEVKSEGEYGMQNEKLIRILSYTNTDDKNNLVKYNPDYVWPLRWWADSDIDNIGVVLIHDNGEQLIAKEFQGDYIAETENDGGCLWSIPDEVLPLNNCVIKIYDTDNPDYYDCSNFSFSIRLP